MKRRISSGALATGIAALVSLALGPRTLVAANSPTHVLGDGCPLCAGGGPMGPDGLPLRVVGDAPPVAKPPPAEFPRIEHDVAGTAQIGFEHLASFRFEPPAAGATPRPGAKERIPATVRALDGQRVALGGFMLPVKMDGALVKEFFIVRSQLACCFGVMPEPTEWVLVRVAGKGVQPEKDVPLQFTGTLRVGEIYDEGAFVALYRIELEKVAAPPAR